MLVESRMRGNVHVRFGGREWGDGAEETRPPRPLPTRHLNLKPEQANIFFKLMEERYRRFPTIITTNLDYDDWYGFLGNKPLVEALLSRLRHQCHTVKIEGPSLRTP